MANYLKPRRSSSINIVSASAANIGAEFKVKSQAMTNLGNKINVVKDFALTGMHTEQKEIGLKSGLENPPNIEEYLAATTEQREDLIPGSKYTTRGKATRVGAEHVLGNELYGVGLKNLREIKQSVFDSFGTENELSLDALTEIMKERNEGLHQAAMDSGNPQLAQDLLTRLDTIGNQIHTSYAGKFEKRMTNQQQMGFHLQVNDRIALVSTWVDNAGQIVVTKDGQEVSVSLEEKLAIETAEIVALGMGKLIGPGTIDTAVDDLRKATYDYAVGKVEVWALENITDDTVDKDGVRTTDKRLKAIKGEFLNDPLMDKIWDFLPKDRKEDVRKRLPTLAGYHRAEVLFNQKQDKDKAERLKDKVIQLAHTNKAEGKVGAFDEAAKALGIEKGSANYASLKHEYASAFFEGTPNQFSDRNFTLIYGAVADHKLTWTTPFLAPGDDGYEGDDLEIGTQNAKDSGIALKDRIHEFDQADISKIVTMFNDLEDAEQDLAIRRAKGVLTDAMVELEDTLMKQGIMAEPSEKKLFLADGMLLYQSQKALLPSDVSPSELLNPDSDDYYFLTPEFLANQSKALFGIRYPVADVEQIPIEKFFSPERLDGESADHFKHRVNRWVTQYGMLARQAKSGKLDQPIQERYEKEAERRKKGEPKSEDRVPLEMGENTWTKNKEFVPIDDIKISDGDLSKDPDLDWGENLPVTSESMGRTALGKVLKQYKGLGSFYASEDVNILVNQQPNEKREKLGFAEFYPADELMNPIKNGKPTIEIINHDVDVDGITLSHSDFEIILGELLHGLDDISPEYNELKERLMETLNSKQVELFKRKYKARVDNPDIDERRNLRNYAWDVEVDGMIRAYVLREKNWKPFFTPENTKILNKIMKYIKTGSVLPSPPTADMTSETPWQPLVGTTIKTDDAISEDTELNLPTGTLTLDDLLATAPEAEVEESKKTSPSKAKTGEPTPEEIEQALVDRFGQKAVNEQKAEFAAAGKDWYKAIEGMNNPPSKKP